MGVAVGGMGVGVGGMGVGGGVGVGCAVAIDWTVGVVAFVAVLVS